MNDQPTHETARITIPFDIDTAAIERKLNDIEKRMKAVSSGVPASQPGPEPISNGTTRPNDDKRLSDSQALILSINRIDDTLRKILTIVDLIYTNVQEPRRNGNGNSH